MQSNSPSESDEHLHEQQVEKEQVKTLGVWRNIGSLGLGVFRRCCRFISCPGPTKKIPVLRPARAGGRDEETVILKGK
jgi:hypothetical protein